MEIEEVKLNAVLKNPHMPCPFIGYVSDITVQKVTLVNISGKSLTFYDPAFLVPASKQEYAPFAAILAGIKPKTSSRLADPTLHLAFKWSFNDAHFKGICGWDTIQYNSSNPGIWCSQAECSRFQKKNSPPRLTQPRDGWPCTEAGLFSLYQFNTGGVWNTDRSESERRDLVIADVNQELLRNKGRLAFMTTRPINASEKHRYVFGFQEIGNVYSDRFEDGANSTHIEGKPHSSLLFHKSIQIPFWSVYSNKKPGEKWGQGLFRYITTEQAIRFLEHRFSQSPNSHTNITSGPPGGAPLSDGLWA